MKDFLQKKFLYITKIVRFWKKSGSDYDSDYQNDYNHHNHQYADTKKLPALHCEERVFLCCFFVIFQYEIGVVDHGVIDGFPFCLDFAGNFDMVTDIDVVIREIVHNRDYGFVSK